MKGGAGNGAALSLCEQVAGQRAQVLLGPGAVMLNDLGGGDGA
jgi:hypothetical protein